MKRIYRLALLCGALPLLFGVSIFLLWVVERWDSLMIAGIYTLVGGVACVAVGAIALRRFWRLGLRVPDLPRPRLRRATLACGLLLLSNFPAAGAITYAAVAIETCYTVLIRNDSEKALESVRVVGGGCEVRFGDVAAGESRRRVFWVEHEGCLALEVNGKQAAILDGYVCAGMGGRATATIRPDGTVSVDWAPR